MCSELAHQHALDDLHKHTEHWSHQEVDHSTFPVIGVGLDLYTHAYTPQIFSSLTRLPTVAFRHTLKCWESRSVGLVYMMLLVRCTPGL
jgi:hypothetical protein